MRLGERAWQPVGVQQQGAPAGTGQLAFPQHFPECLGVFRPWEANGGRLRQ
jgi:hypothetical protein